MHLVKVTIKPKSSFSTPLQSDTLFGHFCWAYKRLNGKEKLLTDIITPSKKDRPSIVFSNGFPAGYLPAPVLSGRIKGSKDVEEYSKIKNIKKFKWVKPEFYNKGTITDNNYFERLNEYSLKEKISDIVSQTHNTVNRITRTTGENGGLFSSNTEATQKSFDIYCLYEETSINIEEIKKTIIEMFFYGYGADRSIGKGNFSVESIEPAEWVSNAKGNRKIAFSNFVPCDLINNKTIMCKVFTKYGKISGDYSADSDPFKKPILMVEAGAVFTVDEDRPFYGRIMQNIHHNQQIIQNACTIFMGFNYDGAY